MKINRARILFSLLAGFVLYMYVYGFCIKYVLNIGTCYWTGFQETCHALFILVTVVGVVIGGMFSLRYIFEHWDD